MIRKATGKQMVIARGLARWLATSRFSTRPLATSTGGNVCTVDVAGSATLWYAMTTEVHEGPDDNDSDRWSRYSARH